MLISTMNDVPGYRVTRVLGECFGLTVRSRNVFSQFGAGLQVAARRRAEGHDQEPRDQPGGGHRTDGRRGRGPGGQRRDGHAVRHLRDGWQLDRDLRLRHRRGHRARSLTSTAVRGAAPVPADGPFLRPAGASRSLTPRCGSCARPGGRCPSTGRPVGTAASWRPSPIPSWPPSSPSSRSAATGSTRPSCSPTSSCRSTPSASGSTWCRAGGRWSAEPFRSAADLDRLRPLEPEVDVPYVAEAVRLAGRRAGPSGYAADRLRRRAVHRGQLPGRGRAVAHLRPGEGADAHRARHCGDRCSTGWPTWRWPSCGPRWPPGPPPCSSSTAGPAASPRPSTRASCCRPPAGCSTRWPTWACRPSSSGWAPGSCSRLMATAGADVVGRGLAGAARRGPAAGRAGLRRAGQPRPGAVPGPVGGGAPRPAQVLAGPGPSPATCSTWATACCPRPTRAILAAVVDLVHAEGRAGVVPTT